MQPNATVAGAARKKAKARRPSGTPMWQRTRPPAPRSSISYAMLANRWMPQGQWGPRFRRALLQLTAAASLGHRQCATSDAHAAVVCEASAGPERTDDCINAPHLLPHSGPAGAAALRPRAPPRRRRRRGPRAGSRQRRHQRPHRRRWPPWPRRPARPRRPPWPCQGWRRRRRPVPISGPVPGAVPVSAGHRRPGRRVPAGQRGGRWLQVLPGTERARSALRWRAPALLLARPPLYLRLPQPLVS